MLRYKAHPSLWYLLLAVPAKLGFPCETANYIGVRDCAAGRCHLHGEGALSRRPANHRTFSFFLSYQYAVIARNYVLIPPLLFTLAVIYPRKSARPLVFSLLCCLLLSTSVLTFIAAGLLMLALLLDVVRDWRRLDGRSKGRQIAAFAMYAYF